VAPKPTLTILAKRVNQLGGWYLDDYGIAATRHCYAHPRSYYCNVRGGRTESDLSDGSCNYCVCIRLNAIFPPICNGFQKCKGKANGTTEEGGATNNMSKVANENEAATDAISSK
jgi:hypothetical protein